MCLFYANIAQLAPVFTHKHSGVSAVALLGPGGGDMGLGYVHPAKPGGRYICERHDPKVIARRDKVEAIWKDIDDARQCGKPTDEGIATDRRGIDRIPAPKLNGHIRKLEAYLHTTTEHPAHEFVRTRDGNITAEYEETDARKVQDPAQQK
jgi:hypothetical protein